MTEPRKNARNTRGKPFQPGNPGRPKGARHKTTMAMEALLDGQADALTQKAIDLALAGDLTALRLCWDRLLPPRKDRPIAFDIGKIETPADAVSAVARVTEAVSTGELTPTDATAVTSLLETYRRLIEVADLERRVADLERNRNQ